MPARSQSGGLSGQRLLTGNHFQGGRIKRLISISGSASRNAPLEKEAIMIGWAATFLVIAIIAGVLGFSGIAGTAVNLAWILFVVGLVLAVVFGLLGRRPRV
jgi:uncharacterized membrane protein YtjA (UPF0391 family)